MRVAVTVEQSWHRVPGGTAASTIELLRALVARDDLDVVGVAARHADPPAPDWALPVPVAHLGLPRPLLYEAWHAPGPLRRPRVESATGPVDVVHATAVAVPPTRGPLVVTVHDLAFLHDRSHATRHGHRFFRRGLELARRHAAAVVVPSQATRRECLEAGIPDDRVHVVGWGVRIPVLAPRAVEEVRARHRLERPYVLFAGTVEPRKNLRRLVDAFAALERDDVELVLVGPDGWHESTRTLLAGLLGRARALGFVPRAELDALMAGAAVVAYPSTREGFGLPVLEAMAVGAPVLTSRGTATEEVGGDAAVLVDPYSVDAIADGLAALLDDPAAAWARGERGRERAAAATWQRCAATHVAVYESVAGGGGARRRRRATPGRDVPPAAATGCRSATTGAAPPLHVGLNLTWLVPGEVGGSETYVTNLLRAVAEHATDGVRLTAFCGPALVEAHPWLADAAEVVVGPAGGSRTRRVATDATWLNRAVRRAGPDVVHHLGGTLPPGSRAGGAPRLLLVHDLQPITHPQHFGRARRTYLRARLGPSVRAAEVVSTVSGWVADDVARRYGVRRADIVVLPTALSAPPPSPPGEVEAVAARLGLDGPWFLLPAITYPHKGHAVAVEALARLHAAGHPDAHLVLAGGAGPAEAAVAAAVARHGVGERVQRAGRVDQDVLEALYAGAAGMCFPSRYEGFGLPVVEAMARGVPVLAADATALPEVAAGAADLLPPDDAAAWAAAMARILDDGPHRARLVAAGLARVGDFAPAVVARRAVTAWRRAAFPSEGTPR